MSDARRNSRIAVELVADPPRERQRVARVLAHEARRARDAVRDDVRAEAARQLDRLRAALERRGQAALGVRERDDDLLVAAPGLDDLAVVGQLVLAERDLELRDRDRNRRDPGHATRRRPFALRGRSRSTLPSSPSASRRAAIEAGSFLRGRHAASSRHAARHASRRRKRSRPMPAQLMRRTEGARGQGARGGRGARSPSSATSGSTTVLVGDDPASHVYINGKHKAATRSGSTRTTSGCPPTRRRTSCSQLLAELNADDAVDGILVQLPLPTHIDETHGDRGARPGEGRRRLPSGERRAALPRPAERSCPARRSGSCACSPSTGSSSRARAPSSSAARASSASRWRTCCSRRTRR